MRNRTIAIVAVAATAVTLGAGTAASAANDPMIPAPCVIRVVLHVNQATGAEKVRVGGHCNGHAPTAGEVSRGLLRDGIVLPQDMHVLRIRARSAIVCFGDCGTSARVWETPKGRGKAETS